ncbi:unnamed protein product [Dracunculus medinensis]|uniref:FAD-binding PCMH-type domain-containing protein n=1 Tax=Dracunculus medinensis TaxID=318479 RepID=A0A0N4UP67_DRAME|nr:unnamed protein product [Dracunculus medinensis]
MYLYFSAAVNSAMILKLPVWKSFSCYCRRKSSFIRNVESIIPQLEEVLGYKNVNISDAVRDQHSHDEGHHPEKRPDVVIFPKNVIEVSTAVKICNEAKIPIIPFGTGTGLEGGINAIVGGVSMDLMDMSDIVSVNVADFDCVVQPGVTHKSLNARLRDTGLWFSVDPGADASICGMAATCASGTNAVRYGTMLHNVINLQVVLANGDILYTNGKDRRYRKTSAGFNLTELFVGSEGTLGIITEATVRLNARPLYCCVTVCSFSTVREAVDAVVAVLQCCIPIAKIGESGTFY